jgi:hypothetical protein
MKILIVVLALSALAGVAGSIWYLTNYDPRGVMDR